MLKKFTKFLLLMLVIFVITSSSFTTFAHENDTESTNTITTTETNEEASTTDETEENIHNGDLYLFDNNIVMDKYVNGNVFLFGNNINITGKVNGNLFVFGNNVKFDESAVRYSIFACANSVYYNGYCGTEYDYGNLYVAAKNFESTYNSYVTGDLKAVCSTIILRAAIYRNADLIANTIDFGSEKDIPLILGNLNYTAINEIAIPEGVIPNADSSVNYTSSFDIVDIVIGFGTCIVTVLSLYIILNKLTPKFVEKLYNNKFSIILLLKAFGIGLATILMVSLFIILLAGTMVGISLAAILALLFTVLCIFATPVLIIKITNALKPTLKIEKASIFYLVLILVSIIVHGITLIPLVGIILNLVINITAIGLIINLFLPHKELTDEAKSAIEEKRNQAKEIKQKRKQERLEAKAAKKEEIAILKEAKKQQKPDTKENKKNNKEI